MGQLLGGLLRGALRRPSVRCTGPAQPRALGEGGVPAWLAQRGYAAITGSRAQGGPGKRRADGLPLFWIASGPSERGLQHATVYADNRLVFDPHPSKAGLLAVSLWTVVVPLGPLWARC